MNKKRLLGLFLSCNVLFILVQIHKHSLMVKLSYAKQKKEAELEALLKKHDDLLCQLQALKNPDAIKKYAHEELKMIPLSLKNIKKFTQS